MRSRPFGFALTSALILVAAIALVCVAEDATPHENSRDSTFRTPEPPFSSACCRPMLLKNSLAWFCWKL